MRVDGKSARICSNQVVKIAIAYSSLLLVLVDGCAHLLQQVAGKNEVGEALVRRIHDFTAMPLPVLVTLVDEDR